MNSIRKQLTISLLLGIGLLLVGSGAAIYFFTRVALVEEFDNGLRAKAVTMMSLTEQGDEGVKLDVPDSYREGAGMLPQYYELWLTNGAICSRSEALKRVELPLEFGPQNSPKIWNVELPNGEAGRAIGLKFTPAYEDEDARRRAPAEAILVVVAERQALDETLTVLAMVLGFTGLLSLLITLPVVNLALRRGLAPLGELARQATEITADSLQTRFPVESMPKELQPVTQRLNDLLGRLAESFERERRFSADLAHELRTPLAELRTLAEVELAWPEGGSSEKHREILGIAQRMETMVTRLMEMIRSENGKIAVQVEVVAVAPLVEEIWAALAEEARKKQIQFSLKVPAEARLETDKSLIRAILTNLLSNAVEYTPDSGRVEISWRSETEELTISNTVEDLNAEDVGHLFERLWRKDKSRTGNEHCGLGLALSQTFAGLLGYRLKARLSDERTLVMTLTWE